MMNVCDRTIRTEGRLLRIGRIVGDSYINVDDPVSMVEGLRSCGARVDLFTFTQLLPDVDAKFSYSVEWENWAVVEVSTYDCWWTKQVDKKTRNMVRKAERKGVVVREAPFNAALVKGICEIYNECPVRQGKPNRHYGLDEATVRKLEATLLNNSIFVGAYLEEQLIAFAKVVIDDNGKQAKIMNIIAMVRHWENAPMNALVAEIVRICADRRIPHCVYGNFTYWNKQNDTLTTFKSNNGFQPVLIPRYYVPLTGLGSIALRFGLQHRLRDRLPESFAAHVRAWRSKWYGKALRTFRAA